MRLYTTSLFYARISAALSIVFALIMATLNPCVAGDDQIILTVDKDRTHYNSRLPIRSGVPIDKEWNITNPAELSLTDSDNNAVPVQIKVTSRWGNITDAKAPIKWVLLDFLSSAKPTKKETYRLTRKPQTAAITGITLQDSGNSIRVDTGSIAFDIKKDSTNLLENIMSKRGANAAIKTASLVVNRLGTEYTGACTVQDVAVEDQGPLHAVIKASGTFKDPSGTTLKGGDARPIPDAAGRPKAEEAPLKFTVRVHAYANKSYIKITTTLENDGNTISTYFPVNDIFIDGFSLKLVTEAPVTSAEIDKTKITDNQFEYLQTHVDNSNNSEKDNFQVSLAAGQKKTKKSERSDGKIRLNTAKDTFTVLVDRFWQRFPKGYSLNDKMFSIDLLPASDQIPNEPSKELTYYSTGRHYFSAGWHMTDTIWLDVLPPGSPSELTPENITLPLFAKCQPEHYSETLAMGHIAPEMLSNPDNDVSLSLKRHASLLRMPIDPKSEVGGRDLNWLRENMYGKRTWYGWENYGDIVHSFSVFSSLIYDWPYIDWLQYVRTGDERFRELALIMTDHSIDMDQLHGAGQDGMWHWEKIGNSKVGEHHKCTQNAGYLVSHTWNGGYALGYLLTGDNRYLDAATRSANYAMKYYSKVIAGGTRVMNQTRSQGWSILMMVNLYRINGDTKLIQDAMRIFTNSLLYTEQLTDIPGSGGKGYIASDTKGGRFYGLAVVTFQTYPLEPLCQLHYEAKRLGLDTTELEQYILRCLKFLKTVAFTGGDTKGELYSPYSLSYATDPINKSNNKGGEIGHDFLLAGPYAYAAMNIMKPGSEESKEYFNFARSLFHDAVHYFNAHYVNKTPYVQKRYQDKTNWSWLPNMPKVHGWIGRSGQEYLYYEYINSKKKQ